MLKQILSISGRPGLFKLVNQGKNMLIVENLATGKRTPAYAHDKVISLGDIAIYTEDEDTPLADVFEAIKEKSEAQPVDVKSLGGDKEIREYFSSILPTFDDDRVYTNDIKKVFSWYNQLIAAGIDKFKDDDASNGDSEEKSKEADEN